MHEAYVLVERAQHRGHSSAVHDHELVDVNRARVGRSAVLGIDPPRGPAEAGSSIVGASGARARNGRGTSDRGRGRGGGGRRDVQAKHRGRGRNAAGAPPAWARCRTSGDGRVKRRRALHCLGYWRRLRGVHVTELPRTTRRTGPLRSRVGRSACEWHGADETFRQSPFLFEP